MSRILFWIILLGAGYWFWRRAKTAAAQMAGGASARGANGANGGRRGPGQPQMRPMPQIAEPMVRCAYCGAHSPRSDTISLYHEHFCNAEHAQRFASGERAAGRE